MNKDFKPKDIFIELFAKVDSSEESTIKYKEKFNFAKQEVKGYNLFDEYKFNIPLSTDILIAKGFLKKEKKNGKSKILHFLQTTNSRMLKAKFFVSIRINYHELFLSKSFKHPL